MENNWQVRLELLEKHFLNRTDKIAVFADWKKPCPAEPLSPIRHILAAHLAGRCASPVRARLLPRRPQVFRGHFRVGTYAPSPDGTTRWACIDIDGGDHSHPLSNPARTALSITETLFEAGLFPFIEKSYSGTGWHIWVFFEEALPAANVRLAIEPLISGRHLLKSGSYANPSKSEGIELFPKQNRIRPGGCGSQVFLPWHFSASGGDNEFHKPDKRGRLVPYQPKSFICSSARMIETLIPGHRHPSVGGTYRRRCGYVPDNPWDEWEALALPKLPLEPVYENYLTGHQRSEEWLECRDPRSPTGDRRPSAGVATGAGKHPRGWFHSFRDGQGMTVFKFMLLFDPMIRSYYDAQVRVGELAGVPVTF